MIGYEIDQGLGTAASISIFAFRSSLRGCHYSLTIAILNNRLAGWRRPQHTRHVEWVSASEKTNETPLAARSADARPGSFSPPGCCRRHYSLQELSFSRAGDLPPDDSGRVRSSISSSILQSLNVCLYLRGSFKARRQWRWQRRGLARLSRLLAGAGRNSIAVWEGSDVVGFGVGGVACRWLPAALKLPRSRLPRSLVLASCKVLLSDPIEVLLLDAVCAGGRSWSRATSR